MAQAQTARQGAVPITEDRLGQVLWAARGRTPHLYKSRHWGMTIPTWGGRQDVSRVYLLADSTVHAYVNWAEGHPTHSLSPFAASSRDVGESVRRFMQPAEKVILLARAFNESYALWEIGYQLLNMILQAHCLDLTYRAVLLNAEQRAILKAAGIEKAEAAIGFQ